MRVIDDLLVQRDETIIIDPQHAGRPMDSLDNRNVKTAASRREAAVSSPKRLTPRR
jgi:hypothetical protein